MRAVVVPQFGEPDVLETHEVAAPQPAGQVSIRVAYASINYADTLQRRGILHAEQPPFVPGIEVAGYIHAVGEGVEGLRVGEPVAAVTLRGGYAELALARADLTFPLDSFGKEIDLAAAAGFPAIGVTAYNLLVDVARLRAGESVLIHAAAGGVGITAAQIARHLEAGQIIGTVGSQEKMTYARSFGYDQVVLRENFVQAVQELTNGRGVDIIFDAAGEPTRSQGLTVLAPFGRLVNFGNASGQPEVLFPLENLRATNKSVMGYSFHGLSSSAPQMLTETARKAFQLLASGQIRVDITKILPMEQAAEAHRLLESGATTGKLLLSI